MKSTWQDKPDHDGHWWWLKDGEFPGLVEVLCEVVYQPERYLPEPIGRVENLAGRWCEVRPPLETIYRCAGCSKVFENRPDGGATCDPCLEKEDSQP